MSGQTVLITGASSGIGAETARRLAARGYHLALAARREERLVSLADELAAEHGRRPAVLAVDLADPGAAADLAERSRTALGPVDVLVNGAGSSLQGLMWVVGDSAAARSVMETNFWSPLALLSELAPSMLERGGVVVNVGSMVRAAPFPHLGHYAASRSALATASQVMGLELGPRRVRVVEVALGPIDAPASRENRQLQGAGVWLAGRPGLGSEAGAASAIVRAVEDERAEGVVFYPRALRWAHRLPALGHRHARRAARGADLQDRAVRLAGSTGDPELRALRDDG